MDQNDLFMKEFAHLINDILVGRGMDLLRTEQRRPSGWPLFIRGTRHQKNNEIHGASPYTESQD